MDLTIDIVARLIGAFYAFGGWLALRYLLTEDVIDKMMAALKASRPEPRDVIRSRVLAVVGLLTCLSGVALALMSHWAVVLFLANVAAQAVWLVWAGRAFPPQDVEEARGRRATINAAVGYTVIAVVVVWLAGAERLGPWTDPWPAAALTLAGLGLVVWVRRHLGWQAGALPELEPWPEEPEPDRRPPTRVRLAPSIGDWTLWDADDGRGLDHFAVLPGPLADRVERWLTVHEEALDPEDVFGPPRFNDPVQARAYNLEGQAIHDALEALFGPGNVEGSLQVEF